MDPVSSSVNNIRTVLPKSNREAAHSPPRHNSKIQVPPPLLIETAMSSSLPQAELATSTSPELKPEPILIPVDSPTSTTYSPKTNPKMIKQRSFSSKTIYRSNSGMTTSRSSDQTVNATQRMFIYSLFFFI
jgi:hypothetical protein